MQHQQLRFSQGFHPVFNNTRGQAAEMVIAPGESEGGPDNAHQGADQWLFVVSGTGTAIVEDKHIPLQAGTLVLIEQQEKHEVRNTGTEC